MQPSMLGDILRKTREKGRHGSIEVFSKKLNVNKNTLGSYERGDTLPDLEFLTNFAKVSNIKFLALLQLRLLSSKDEATISVSEEINKYAEALQNAQPGIHGMQTTDIINESNAQYSFPPLPEETSEGVRIEDIIDWLAKSINNQPEIIPFATKSIAKILKDSRHLTPEGYNYVMQAIKSIEQNFNKK